MSRGAAEQIHFVGIGGRDQKLRIPHTGLQQSVHGSAVSVNAHDIIALLTCFQNTGIGVDEGNVVTFGAEQAGQSAANLAVTGNNNIHKLTS